ncbi:SH3 domain-containing protein [Paraoerskovia marina]|uniref:SH3 domain-containing protein n=1 Tax=Paraoerskovia marina TaxID=545619 RepID=UPI0009E05DBD|nr:SH3 domain-containing protein [Paraoerskovia marina]
MSVPRRRLVALLLAVALALVPNVVGVALAGPAAAATTVAAPLPNKTYVLSSYYGPRCMPVKGASTSHAGQDMGAASGTDVRAVAAGTVTRAGAIAGFGQWVVIDHTVDGVKFASVYGHVIDGDSRVRVGQKVSKGQHIADVGSSGTSTAPHLHLEIWKGRYGSGGTVTDPLPFLKARGIDLTTLSSRNYARTVPSSCTYYTTTKVNFRTGPSTAYAVIATLGTNTRLTAKPGDGSGSWRKVTANGRTGWMHKDYVSPSETPIGTRYVRISSLNFRAGPSTSSAIIGSLSKNTSVALLGTVSDGWVKVRAAGKTGYVYATYLSTSTSITGSPYRFVAVDNLNFRAGPSTSTAVLARLAENTTVRLVEAPGSGSWVKVTAGGKTGYLYRNYLRRSPEYAYVTLDQMPMRSGPSTRYSPVITLPYAKAVRPIGTASNGWIRAEASGKAGYLYTKYLSSSRP